ncbi:putative porin [Paraburkholderia sp. BL8N3]|nr:putative porin [Paraburkholderia sp. BL8N3]
MAFAASLPFASLAHAQSSVTLYGLIDEGFEAVSNTSAASGVGGRQFRLDSASGLNSSRWGLRGSEDLGGGLRVLFQLENGFELNNGRLSQGGAEFGRQAFVGLSSNRFGTVTLGRQYDSVVDFVGGYAFADTNVGTAHAAHPADLDNFNNSRRTNNAVKFKSIDYAGLTFGGVYSFGGVPGAVGTNQIYSVGVGYKNGPLAVGAAYLNARNPATSLFGSNPSDTATSNGLTGSPVFSGYASADSYHVAAVAATYEIGAAVFGVNWSNVRFAGIAALNNGTEVFNDVEASVQYHVTPRLLAGVAYNYLHGSSITGSVGGANYNQVGAGVEYVLSVRTDVYAAVDYQVVNGHDSTGRGAVANLAGLSPSSNRYQTVGRVGIRHRF